jgi:putative transposase
MARLARVLSTDTPFHVTQRGNARQAVFEHNDDHLVYLDLLQAGCRLHHLAIVGYCLMSNHVHLIAIPRGLDSLPLALKHAHGRYAAYFNTRHGLSGHVWQGRYYSCPLDTPHLWAALRYTELNPVRAGMVAHAEDHPWSTAGAHGGWAEPVAWLENEVFTAIWTPSLWREYLSQANTADADATIREKTHTGRPLGSADFVAALEQSLRRKLAPGKGGRPAREPADERQHRLTFDVE